MYCTDGERIRFYSDKLKLIDGQYVAGEPLTSLWDDILSNNLHNEGGVEFPKGKKPEALIKRCFDLATKPGDIVLDRSEEHTSELQSLMRISYAVFCLKKKKLLTIYQYYL